MEKITYRLFEVRSAGKKDSSRMPSYLLLLAAFFVLASPRAQAAPGDILMADFEEDDYGKWKVEGAAFGTGPAPGTLPGQMAVEGFLGKGLVNSFTGGD